MGHKGEDPKWGKGMVCVVLRSCMVLDHFSNSTAPALEGMKSPRAN